MIFLMCGLRAISIVSWELNRNIATRGRKACHLSAELAQKKVQLWHEDKPKLMNFDKNLKESAVAMLIEKK